MRSVLGHKGKSRPLLSSILLLPGKENTTQTLPQCEIACTTFGHYTNILPWENTTLSIQVGFCLFFYSAHNCLSTFLFRYPEHMYEHPEEWTYHLTQEDIQELDATIQKVKEKGIDIAVCTTLSQT